jgi:V8-like Glu-specific endopeptidase
MGELQALLSDAFSRPRFQEILLTRLGRHIDDFVAPVDDYRSALLRVIDDANRALWWADLLVTARNARPTDAGLQAFGARFDLAPAVIPPGGARMDSRQLEVQIRKTRWAHDITEWRTRLGEIEGRVCRIEFPVTEGRSRATGFLVGPDVVMTNYHVIKPILDGKVDPSSVVLLFDHLYSADGSTLRKGTPHRLAEEWCLEFSPYSVSDRQAEPVLDPGDDELDYALLRVRDRPGEEPVGGPSADPQPVPRGWIAMPQDDYDFESSPALHIVQHPGGRPMVVVLDTEAVIGVNTTGTRVRYRTGTSRGSSGSPCFGPDWQWMALHHSGDADYLADGLARYNQGITVSALRRATARWNVDGALGG